MTADNGIDYRRKYRGLIGIRPKAPIRDAETLSLVYTPGVARPCLEIAREFLTSFDYTMRGNTVAIVSDGSSVYGMGNIGATAAIPMLETKSVFHKTFAGIDGFPMALDTQDVDEIVETIRYLSPTFGGIHLEDISSPRCFSICERLKRAISLPIIHTDQEATAVVVYAGLLNALKLVGKRLENSRIVIAGAGASGVATARLLHRLGAGDIKVCDRHGALYYRRTTGLNWIKSELARLTNPEDKKGSLADMLVGADVLIGLAHRDLVTPEMIRTMAADPIVFALALAEPEIPYEEARAAGARVVATGRSDFPNQMNCSMVYPGLFRGALDVRATGISHDMLVAAARAVADLVDDNALSETCILPGAMDYRIAAKVARAVASEAIAGGQAQTPMDPQAIEDKVMRYVYEGPGAWVEPPSPQPKTRDEEALELHKRYQGVMEITAHVPIRDEHIYNQLYAQPRASEPCRRLQQHPEEACDITLKNNLVAIVTDGSAVLGLGNIGPAAGLPVMEGKAVLFKTFGGVEAFPICLRTQEIDEIVKTVQRIAPVFGGINLEDIAAPRCFEVEQRLIDMLDIPVFHDDQHGTAVVVVAGMLNAVKVVGKQLSDIHLVVNGAGASALSVSKLLMRAGVRDITICDTKGVIYRGRKEGMNKFKDQIAEVTNLADKRGTLEDVLAGADAFLGLSAAGMLKPHMVQAMAPGPIIFALANPTPEIMPDEALAAGAAVVATGRSDFPNQVNNSLAFPGIFRGALDVRASRINDDMKLAAAHAIASLVSEQDLAKRVIIPSSLDFRVSPAVAGAVAEAAIATGVARHPMAPADVQRQLKGFLYEGHLATTGA